MAAWTAAAQLLLAAVFAVAGSAKLLDRSGFRGALVAFGVPRSLVGTVAVVLPGVEVAVAALLVVPATALIGAMLGWALLVAFSAGMFRSLAQGHEPECRCFGRVRATPIGPRVLARNGLLIVVATLIVTQANAVLGAGLGLLPALAVVAGRPAWRRRRTLEPPAEGAEPAGLPVGSKAPSYGRFAALRRAGRPVLLAFVNPGCAHCTALLPELSRYQAQLGANLTVALLSTADATMVGVATAYRAVGTPSAVLIDASGYVASPLAQGAAQIRRLVMQFSSAEEEQPWRS